jgi:hypothetical protein
MRSLESLIESDRAASEVVGYVLVLGISVGLSFALFVGFIAGTGGTGGPDPVDQATGQMGVLHGDLIDVVQQSSYRETTMQLFNTSVRYSPKPVNITVTGEWPVDTFRYQVFIRPIVMDVEPSSDNEEVAIKYSAGLISYQSGPDETALRQGPEFTSTDKRTLFVIPAVRQGGGSSQVSLPDTGRVRATSERVNSEFITRFGADGAGNTATIDGQIVIENVTDAGAWERSLEQKAGFTNVTSSDMANGYERVTADFASTQLYVRTGYISVSLSTEGV